MSIKKWIKVVFVILFVVLAGIFYSCRAGNKEEVTLIADTEDNIIIEEDSEPKEVGSSIQSKDYTNNINTKNKDTGEISDSENSSKYIYVHICGEVIRPEVYKVQKNTRVYEVIAKAGGLTETAADSYINQASIVTDGQQIYIPSIDEVTDGLPTGISNIFVKETTTGYTNKENDGTVNINEALADELMTLSGVGQAKAQAIIDYRRNNGEFQTIDEIKNIDGIKDAVYNKIKDKITVK